MLHIVLPLLSLVALSLGQTVYTVPCTSANNGVTCSCFLENGGTRDCASPTKIDAFIATSKSAPPDCTAAAAGSNYDGPCVVGGLGFSNNCGFVFTSTGGNFNCINIGNAFCCATPSADLSISKTDGSTTATPGFREFIIGFCCKVNGFFSLIGGPVTYTIVATNNGPNAADGATVTDTFAATMTGCTWTCAGSSGAVCASQSGSGNINVAITSFPMSGTATLTAICEIVSSATGTLNNTAKVMAPNSVSDPNTGNNEASDVDELVPW